LETRAALLEDKETDNGLDVSLEDVVEEETRSSRDTWDKDNNVHFSETDSNNGHNANGLDGGKEPKSPEGSTKEPGDASPTWKPKSQETYAGTTNKESSRDLSETEEDVLSTDKQEVKRSSALAELLEKL
jgi:hypothetical protein